jgi:hypothetical protein
LRARLKKLVPFARWFWPAELAVFLRQFAIFGALLWIQFPGKKGEVYNVLWVLVFGFATINILSLGARRFDPGRRRLNFGEMLAILVVIVSMCLLTWEMLYLFKVLPIKLRPR